MELFAQALAALREERAYAPKVLAITGTNGKTTVTSLTGMLCRRAGLTTKVAGNISPAVLDVLRVALIEDAAHAKVVAEQQRLEQEAAEQAEAEAEAEAVAVAERAATEAQSAQLELSEQVEAEQEAPQETHTEAYAETHTEAQEETPADNPAEAEEEQEEDNTPLQLELPPPEPERVYTGILPQAWVLELSSFQLHTTYSLQADAATVLNITQDHLDWHGSMDAYAADKAKIFGDRTVRVLNRDDALVMKMATSGAAVSSFGLGEPVKAGSFGLVDENGMLWLAYAAPVEDDEKPEGRRRKKDPKEVIEQPFLLKRLMPADALKIRGLHNALNGLAALALCRAVDLPLASLLHGLRDYSGEPHRVELVMTIRDVEYYDDSKGTNVGATVAALNGLGHGGKPNRLLLIAGGDGKGQDFSSLAEPLSKYGRAVFLIGRDAAAIRAAVADAGIELIDCATLEEAVEKAGAMAQGGDAVLLSPACASLDMFRNYAHRAEVFVDAVRELALSRGEVM
jgi:UDP-N-acetylmuramoylalanine--D-glutamate ligase